MHAAHASIALVALLLLVGPFLVAALAFLTLAVIS